MTCKYQELREALDELSKFRNLDQEEIHSFNGKVVRASDIKGLLAERDALCEALDSIQQYGSDTLTGPDGGISNDRNWHREAVLEMTKLARAALAD